MDKLIIQGKYDGCFWWSSLEKSDKFWANFNTLRNKVQSSSDQNEGSKKCNQKFTTMEDVKISSSLNDHDYGRTESFTYKDITNAESLGKYL